VLVTRTRFSTLAGEEFVGGVREATCSMVGGYFSSAPTCTRVTSRSLNSLLRRAATASIRLTAHLEIVIFPLRQLIIVPSSSSLFPFVRFGMISPDFRNEACI